MAMRDGQLSCLILSPSPPSGLDIPRPRRLVRHQRIVRDDSNKSPLSRGAAPYEIKHGKDNAHQFAWGDSLQWV